MCSGIIALFQIGVGVPTNFFLLFFYLFNFFIGHRTKPIHVIYTQMNFINIMMFLSKGGSDVLTHLGMGNFMNDTGCKLVFYLHRLSLALSICFTCYLCTFQAIIISSSVSRLGNLKAWILDHIIHSCLFFWIFNLVIEIPVLFSMTGLRYMKNITYELNFGYCSLKNHNDIYLFMITVRNVFCVVLIVCVSCYIVYLLYRHQEKVQTICSSSILARVSPEIRATKTVLLLVSAFVFCYSLTSICTICIYYFYQERFWLLSICTTLSLCFPTVSPFILLSSGSRISLGLWAGKNSNRPATQLPK
ncbi:vomeronasal type-1 receptor 4-like [Dromiciops gliroides]|uniref:vomeronasal type-1 receptor 4-like n=1 Tax=Dromiciops gliroides TaxID=33562 RepID=UPI001CC669FC|nr:vomeronasal type-1 receptor 4-like [Dromiciops gliroides]